MTSIPPSDRSLLDHADRIRSLVMDNHQLRCERDAAQRAQWHQQEESARRQSMADDRTSGTRCRTQRPRHAERRRQVMSDWKKLRELAEAATPDGEYGPYTNRHMQVSVPLEEFIALLDDNDSLRAEVERLRKDAQAARLETITAIGEAAELERQLSAALAAKDEACEIALQWAAHLRDLHGDPRDRTRIVELRSIGKDGGNG